MSTTSRSGFSALARLGAATLMSVGLIAGGMALPASAEPREPLQYVALGDSYSSGVGAGELTACGVSPLGFPGLLDRKKSIELVANPSCGGAETEDLFPGDELPAQILSLSEGTDLVTVTIGGNDVGFATVAAACSAADPSVCSAAIVSALEDTLNVLPGELATTFGAIRGAAPNAHVVVMGYPQLFSPKFAPAGTSTDAAMALNNGVTTLNSVIEGVALSAGFEYIDVTKEFRNHGIGAPQPWIHAGGEAPLHPTAEGYKKGYLKAFKTEVQINKLQKATAGS